METMETIALIVAMTELIKLTGLPTKWSPFVSVVISLVITIAPAYLPESTFNLVMEGLKYGLMSAGLYKVVDDKVLSNQGFKQ